MKPSTLKQRYHEFARVAPVCIALVAIAVCAIAKSPLAERYPDLLGFLDYPVPTALAFVFASVSLWLWTHRLLTPAKRRMAQIFGGVVLVMAAAEIALQMTLADADIFTFINGDSIFGWDSPPPAYLMTPQAALCFLLLSIPLMFPRWRIGSILLGPIIILLVIALSGFTLLRYLYVDGYLIHAVGLYRMRPAAAFLLLVLSWAILCGNLRGGLAVVFFSTEPMAKGLRRLLLLIVLALPILGGMQLFQQRNGWHPSELGISLLVISSIFFFTIAVLQLGGGLIRAELLRRRADHRRAQRDADFIATFEQAAVGIAHVSTTGRLFRTNKRFAEILGHTQEELQTTTFQQITYEEDLPTDLALFQEVIQGKIDHYSCEKRYIRKDGSLVWCHLTVASLHDSKGRLKYLISTVEDITETKKNAERLAAADRAKDHFISIISHELRTPLTPVLAALSDPAPLDAGTIAMMRRNIEHEASIINDLLDLTRISASGKLQLELRPVALHPLIRETVDALAGPLRNRQLFVHLRLVPENPVVYADPIRLRQILFNLLDNAIKFTREGGSITITTRLGETSSQCEAVEIAVADTGKGIAPDRLTSIFNPFEQESESSGHGGLGLGLAIVKALVEAHGGTIHAANGSPGAIFTFTLCRSHEQPQLQSSATQPLLPVAQDARILLVEDHADTRAMMKRILERRGYTVVAASKASEAVQAARSQPFDLCISDVGLPDQSGHGLLAQLRAEGFTFPAIALSGFGTENDIRQSTDAGFLYHLTKPIEMHKLEQMITEILSSKT